MAIALAPLVPTAAEAAWALTGAVAIEGGRQVLNQAVQDIRRISREDASRAATEGCWRCDDQTCQKLRRQVDGNHEELRDRTKDLVEDRQNLPYRAAGDVANPSLSVWGHE